MQATVEISLNPLTENYDAVVTDFCERLKQYNGIKVEVNGLSTQLFGDYDRIMEIIQHEVKGILAEQPAVFHLKMAKGILTRERLPNRLK